MYGNISLFCVVDLLVEYVFFLEKMYDRDCVDFHSISGVVMASGGFQQTVFFAVPKKSGMQLEI